MSFQKFSNMLHLVMYTGNAVATRDMRCQVGRESADRLRIIVAHTILSADIYHRREIMNLSHKCK